MTIVREPSEALFQKGERVVLTERIPRAGSPYPLVAEAGDAGTVLGAHRTARPMVIEVLLDAPRTQNRSIPVAEDALAPEPDSV